MDGNKNLTEVLENGLKNLWELVFLYKVYRKNPQSRQDFKRQDKTINKPNTPATSRRKTKPSFRIRVAKKYSLVSKEALLEQTKAHWFFASIKKTLSVSGSSQGLSL